MGPESSDDFSSEFEELQRKCRMSFQRQFEEVQETVEQINLKFKSDEPKIKKQGLSDAQVMKLATTWKTQQEERKRLLKEFEEYSTDIGKLDEKIKENAKTLKELEEELSVHEDEYKQMKQTLDPLKIALAKYSVNLNMEVEVKDLKEENLFVATVKFASKDDSKAVDFTINKKDRCVIGFNASSILSEEEASNLKLEATGINGLDVNILLGKIRFLCL